MDFEWDEAKNQQNIAKHGIDFENAKHIFDKPVLLRLDDRRNYGENRFIATGAMKEYCGGDGVYFTGTAYADYFSEEGE